MTHRTQDLKSRLAAIRWETLRDAYGPASSVPTRILDLTSASDEAREDALEQLWMGLCHQRVSLSEASAYAVPFLLELAAAKDARSCEGILELVQGMAEVSARAAEPAAAATRGALHAHVDELFALLADAEAAVRARASLILAPLAMRDLALRARFEHELPRRYSTEESMDARTAFVAVAEAIGALVLLRAALDDAAYAPRLAAALALLSHDEPTSPAFQIVRSALADVRRAREDYGSASRYRPLDFAESAKAGGARATSLILPALLELLAQSSVYEAKADLEPLLDVYFPKSAAVPTLPTREQAAIAAVVASKRGYFGSVGNATALLGMHGLPSRPRPLREYAARGPAAQRELLPKLTREPASPDEMFQSLVGKGSLDALSSVRLIGDASDELLQKLGVLPKLEYLTIKSSQLSARGFQGLPAFKSLTLEDLTLDQASASAIAQLPLVQLKLEDVTLDDAALAALGTSTTLQGFMLLTSPVSGSGFAAFSGSPLSSLVLGRELGLGSQAIPAVATLPHLRALRIIASGVREDWLAALGESHALQELVLRELTLTRPLQLPAALTELGLPGCSLSAQLLAALAQHPQLTQLDLEQVELGSEHVAALARLQQLETLKMSASRIAPAALEALRNGLPRARFRVLP